eukprot:TRINITY_DN441_c2_g1_i1.p1 TRINITY_DN441_c2_g1~~TRINITY_DN441_c2_g1_i1.p1  ORF type:complete len:268 (+),score=45.37 TRINITY_DN441_c2_g1_i1:133-936(+)
MKQDGVCFLRSGVLVVSLISSVDCGMVFGFSWVVLILVWWVLEKSWRETKREMKRGEQLLMVSTNLRKAGILFPEYKRDLMASSGSINLTFRFENRCFRLLEFLYTWRDSSGEDDGAALSAMDSGDGGFIFPAEKCSGEVGRILLVEDTEINRMLLRKLFRDLNLLLEEAENGQIAVDYFKQGKNYDLVLMDKEMPVMDGHEATRQLRLLGVKTPIVALTGNSLQSDKDKFFQAGADEFQTKPLSREELVRLLARYGLKRPTRKQEG